MAEEADRRTLPTWVVEWDREVVTDEFDRIIEGLSVCPTCGQLTEAA